jgi:hypothetical protein
MNAEADLEVLKDYLNLGVSLTELTKEWSSKDEHYAFVNERLQVLNLLRLMLLQTYSYTRAKLPWEAYAVRCSTEFANPGMKDREPATTARKVLQGCRMMRQDPVECLFQFICSSNNHISRIHGMVNHLCVAYGTKLEWVAGACSSRASLFWPRESAMTVS